MPLQMSRTSREKGAFGINRLVLFWYLLISLSATVPGLKRPFFLSPLEVASAELLAAAFETLLFPETPLTLEAIVLDGTATGNAASHPHPADRDQLGHDIGTSRSMMMTVTTAPEHTYQTSNTCVVCLDSMADHIVVPCGHVCLCLPCSAKVRQTGLCPVGRCVVGNVLKIEGDGGEDAVVDATGAAATVVAPVC